MLYVCKQAKDNRQASYHECVGYGIYWNKTTCPTTPNSKPTKFSFETKFVAIPH